MSVVSGKALWSIICGQNVLASEEVVGEELQLAADHLKEGLSFYHQFSETDHTEWCSKSKLKKHKKDFVYKVAKLLDVCSAQSWEIFQLFLQHEYKGSISHLSTISTSDREETNLLNQVLSFFLSDQLHLLSCRRHLLFNHETHAYKNLFKNYLNVLLDPKKTLGSEIICQLQKLTISKMQNDSSLLPPNAMQELVAHRLVAIKHHLATLIIYYGVPTRKCPPQSVIQLLQLAQAGGLGCKLLENFDNIERSIYSGHVEAINAFHCILLTLIISPDEDPQKHHLCSQEHVKQIDHLMKTLGSKVWHSPPLLSWVIIQGKRAVLESGGSSTEAHRYSVIAQRAIKPNLFQYLHSILSNSSIKMDFILQSVSVSVSYTLISVLGSCFDFEKLNFTAEVSAMAQLCLSSSLTSQFFWEDESGAASVFLPPALEAFPHYPHYLLRICTALASASISSCEKVVQLMCELENFTWPLKENDMLIISINSSQCVAKETIIILPGLCIPEGTHGSLLENSQAGGPLICWQLPTNGWLVLLAAFKTLYSQIENGSFAEDWFVETVVEGLKLLCAIMKTDKSQLSLLVHLQEASRRLLISVSRILKPNYYLIAALLEFFAAAATCSSHSVINELDGSPLLPVLPISYLKLEDKSDILVGYRAGKIRSLICGEEVASGSYPILKSICSILESTIKMGISHSHVYGTLIFIVKEILPSILQWTFINPFEKVSVIHRNFSLLHQALEAKSVEESVKLLVVSELVGPYSGSGRILRAVLEGGILVDRLLDQPAEWPLSEYCMRCNKVSQLALSLTHRLVGRYLKLDVNNQSQLTDILGGSNKRDFRGNPQSSAHIGLTVARFVHHRLNPRLTYLSLRTLTHFAKELKVPLVACFSTEAEGLRDCLLTRLGSATEDIKLKGALLKFLTTSSKYQPGIIRLFLTPPENLLQTIVALITSHSKVETEASSELLGSLIEMIAALWEGNFTAATSYLREKEEFWNALSYRLMECNPGTETDEVIANVIKIFSLEYFESTDKVCQGLKNVLKQFVDPSSDVFSKWCNYILVTCTTALLNGDCENSDGTILLLQNWRDFVIVLMKRSTSLLCKEQKAVLGLKGIQGLNLILESDSEKYPFLNIILAETHLHIMHRSSKDVIVQSDYKLGISRLLSNLKISLMQTTAKCQLPIFASVVKVMLVSDAQSKEIAGELVEYALLLCEQHCSLMKYFTGKNDTNFSSPGVLALSCALLHQCLNYIPNDRIQTLLEESHIGHSLLLAATSHTEIGNTAVVKVILRLMSMMVRIMPISFDITCNSIAESVSLVLSSQTEEVKEAVLPDLLLCVISCLKREGPSALDDTINIISLHLTNMTDSFENPHLKANSALASASMCDILATHHSLWRVLHPHSFFHLMSATAAGIHKTTKLLMLKETVEREALGTVTSSEDQSSATAIQSVNLMNTLIKILGTCLHALHPVSPDVEEILCRGVELSYIDSLDTLLIQPTCRRVSTDLPMTLPNLATLADILYLYNVFLPKEMRNMSPLKGVSLNTQPQGIDLQALTQCTENALFLLLSHSTLILTSSDLPRRDAREVKTFLVDETERFFTQWLGKRSLSSSPVSSSLGVVFPSIAYIKLCSQLVTSICQVCIS